MEDCIKIEEIKMFLGTGLSCQFENPRWEEDYQQRVISDKLKGIIGNDIYIEDEMLGLEEIMPLVKPLTDITKEQWMEVFKAGMDEDILKYCNEYFDMQIHYTSQVFRIYDANCGIDVFLPSKQLVSYCYGGGFIVKERFRFNQLRAYNKLAEYHADIFNWIGRGLGKEIK